MFVNKKAIDTLIEEILNFNNQHVKCELKEISRKNLKHDNIRIRFYNVLES
jgi:hypothetical protein